MSPCQVITVQSARSVRLSYFSVKLASGLGTGFGPVVVILVTGVDSTLASPWYPNPSKPKRTLTTRVCYEWILRVKPTHWHICYSFSKPSLNLTCKPSLKQLPSVTCLISGMVALFHFQQWQSQSDFNLTYFATTAVSPVQLHDTVSQNSTARVKNPPEVKCHQRPFCDVTLQRRCRLPVHESQPTIVLSVTSNTHCRPVAIYLLRASVPRPSSSMASGRVTESQAFKSLPISFQGVVEQAELDRGSTQAT